MGDTPTPPVTALEHADNRTLVGRAVDGDIRAFEIIITRHRPVMSAYGRKILGRTDDVDDVVQDSLITAWNQLHTLNNAAMLRSWLLRIVSHKSIDRIRSRHDHDDITDHNPATTADTNPETLTTATLMEQRLAQVLAALPARQRQCWTLKELGNYSYHDIADQLGLPVSTVRGLLSRARKTVIYEMEQWR